jgi:hypothetical protein
MTRIASEDPEQARKDEAARGLLDNYERAAVDVFECNGIPDSWDEEEQQDIDDAKLEAANRLLRIRKRLFAIVSASQADGLLVPPEALQAMCEEARRDEINRAADWMLACADKALERAGSTDWEEAQFLFRYASLLRDLSPFPYTIKRQRQDI